MGQHRAARRARARRQKRDRLRLALVLAEVLIRRKRQFHMMLEEQRIWMITNWPTSTERAVIEHLNDAIQHEIDRVILGMEETVRDEFKDDFVQFSRDIVDLLPWVQASRHNAAQLYCALSNVIWRKGDLQKSSTFRSNGAFVSELFNLPKGKIDYMEFYLSGTEGAISKHVFDYLKGKGWTPYAYGRGDEPDPEITEPTEPEIYRKATK